MDIEVLDEQIVYQNGPFRRVKRWLRGVHPSLGVITKGLTGLETLVEKDIIVPTRTFHVIENSNASQTLLRGTDSQCPEQINKEADTIPFRVDRDAIQCDQGSPTAFVQAG